MEDYIASNHSATRFAKTAHSARWPCVLHHLRYDDDWSCAFHKLYDLLAPGGSVWITDLVFHERREIHAMMWDRYGQYLTSIGDDR